MNNELPQFRPPAVPLVAHDPYFSVWSFGDRLTDGWPRHWTGRNQSSSGIIRIDGSAYRYMGVSPTDAPAMEQVSVEVLPTRTVYVFRAGGIELGLTFTTPALADDLDILARPLTYLSWDVRSTDGRAHKVAVHFDVQGEWMVDSSAQPVTWGRHRVAGLSVQRMGAADQQVLKRSGDDLRIEWGYLYLAIPSDAGASDAAGPAETVRAAFVATGKLPAEDDTRSSAAVSDGWPVLAIAFDFGKVAADAAVSRHAMIAYDDVFCIEYLRRKLRPYWQRLGWTMGELLKTASAEREALFERCARFDKQMMADLRAAGGEKYARLCALSYREAIAAHKLAIDIDGTPLFFSKENFSNGCIATVDVTYPSAPLFLLVQPELLRGMLTPIFQYAASSQWRFPFAPHDLGQYPLANGQVYGGAETSERDQMPVEECGNMLILTAALAHVDGNADYAKKYWPLLQQWAAYLADKGFDPPNQLCTDDFAGHLAHNANLSTKAIMGLAGFARLCEMAGDAGEATKYRGITESFAKAWLAAADDGDHYRLAFDAPGSWSQKYNLIWDTLLGLNVFPPSVAKKELAYYRAHKNTPNGLPLDNRKTYTKLDWIVWTACLTGDRGDFDALVGPAYDWAHSSPSRVPLTDWYETADGKQVGFQARSVVGGLFIRLLQDSAVWEKWVSLARAKRAGEDHHQQ